MLLSAVFGVQPGGIGCRVAVVQVAWATHRRVSPVGLPLLIHVVTLRVGQHSSGQPRESNGDTGAATETERSERANSAMRSLREAVP